MATRLVGGLELGVCPGIQVKPATRLKGESKKTAKAKAEHQKVSLLEAGASQALHTQQESTA